MSSTRHRARLGVTLGEGASRCLQLGCDKFAPFRFRLRKKGKMKTIKTVGLAFGVLIASIGQSFCQTNLQFTAATSTDEQAIRLTWASQPNHVYQIQCANALATNANGSTAWQLLYDDYPSQGTNTFWLDTGNYNLAPSVVHPKNSPMRFYRILDEGADSLSDEPNVSIISPTSGSAVSDELTITVIAATDQPVISGTKFYVDGQEMQMAGSTTNWNNGSTNYEMDTYNINTCEWGNETHTLFATVESESGFGDTVGAGSNRHRSCGFSIRSSFIQQSHYPNFFFATVFQPVIGTNPTSQRGIRCQFRLDSKHR